MTLEMILQAAHSGVRWLVVAAAIAAFVWLLLGLFRARPYDKLTYRVMLTFSSLVGAQWMLGMILLLIKGDFARYQWEHAATMTGALIVAHLYMPFRRRADMTRYRAGLAVIVGVAVLVYIGVAQLPYNGWVNSAVSL